MSKRQQPEDRPVIVQFFHPGRECPVGRRTNGAIVSVSWNGGGCESKSKSVHRGQAPKCRTICGGHTRRLISHIGKYVDESGRLQTAQLAFWGEWEAATTAAALPPTKRKGLFARWVHTVESPLGTTGRKGTNTDPCVFGSTFKYCCCQQHKKGETQPSLMRRLSPGSLVLFGSNVAGKFALDTIFVVGETRIPYETKESYAELGVSKEYLELTLNRLKNRESDAFYRGAPFRRINQMYSFTPAKIFKTGDYRCGERFVLNVKKLNKVLRSTEAFSSRLKQKQGLHSIETEPSTIFAVWSKIVALVRESGFVPGVSFNWPQ